MNFIQSQFITAKLTKLLPQEDYINIKKTQIYLVDHGETALLYKPPGFWISVDGDWERWCTSENFRDVEEETIADIYLKPNLVFIKISTVDDAEELIQFLLPKIKDEFPELGGEPFLEAFPYRKGLPVCDLLNFSRYQINEYRKGNRLNQRDVWANALNTCDGIYYENSWELHMHSIFNTWDASSIMLFDPRNIASIVYHGVS